MALNIFEHWARAVFLGTAEGFQLRIGIAGGHGIVGGVVDGFKRPGVWISIWAVDGSLNWVLIVAGVDVDHRGFVIGCGIEICVAVFFIDGWAMFCGGGAGPPLVPVGRSFFIVSWP